MEIKKITYINRNDFKAVFHCEKCKYEFEAWGYFDYNYYYNVLPNAICPNCGKNSYGENKRQLKERCGRYYMI